MELTHEKREGYKERIEERFAVREITLSLGHSKILGKLAVECMHQLQDESRITELLTEERKLPENPALIQSIAYRLGLPAGASQDAVSDHLVSKTMERFYVRLGSETDSPAATKIYHLKLSENKALTAMDKAKTESQASSIWNSLDSIVGAYKF